jgi:16S rRNA (uracil1498-N3)-methyltransferase
MHRFFIPPESFSSSEVTFPAEQARQIARVLRLKPGVQVWALDGRGMEARVELTQVEASQVSGQIIAQQPALGEPRVELSMYLCLTQREKFEWMLQKCTEVGASSFVPVISSRSLVQSVAETEHKRERWERILQEAAEQCGRGKIPQLQAALNLQPALQAAQQSGARCILPWEEERSCSLQQALGGERPARVALLIGPEGGFSEEEAAAAVGAGFQLATLGRRILRAETAAVVAAALTLYELGEMGCN